MIIATLTSAPNESHRQGFREELDRQIEISLINQNVLKPLVEFNEELLI